MSPPPGFTFAMAKRVRWSDVDPQQVVFNPNYLVYADTAFTEYMRAIGLPFPQPFGALGIDIFAVRAEADFRASARFDDMLTIAARAARLGRTSFTIAFAVLRGEERLADIANVYVTTDIQAGGSVPLPDLLVERIVAYELTPPDRG